jgi:hypothetical protein
LARIFACCEFLHGGDTCIEDAEMVEYEPTLFLVEDVAEKKEPNVINA